MKNRILMLAAAIAALGTDQILALTTAQAAAGYALQQGLSYLRQPALPA